MNPYRKLLVLGINKLLSEGLISLAATGAERRNDQEAGHVISYVAGAPTVISWSNVGHDELRVSVWWNYDESGHPQANMAGAFREQLQTSAPLAKRPHYPKFVGAVVSGSLERKTGPFLQGKGREGLFDLYVRRGDRAALDALADPKPKGFAAEGKVFL